MSAVRALGLIAAIVVVTGCASPQRRSVPPVGQVAHHMTAVEFTPVASAAATLTVMTLNTAHGRSDGWHQLFQSATRHRSNLDDIATVLRREQPHIVALQEADGPSAWSGRFSHVQYLADSSGYSHFVRGEHVRGAGLKYGTALLSDRPLDDPLAVTFEPSFTGTAKGFVVSAIRWPGQPTLLVDIVSLHLDPLRGGVRQRQLAELSEVLDKRDRPVIVMGDFNCRWFGRKKILQNLMTTLNLQTVPGISAEQITLPKMGRRLDWIFVSPEFEISAYDTLTDVISDHRAVVAEISLRPPLVIATSGSAPTLD